VPMYARGDGHTRVVGATGKLLLSMRLPPFGRYPVSAEKIPQFGCAPATSIVSWADEMILVNGPRPQRA
jgi:hypothetical protein